MSVQLRRRIERMERLADALQRGQSEYASANPVVLVPEILIAGRERIWREFRSGRQPVPNTPERLEELRRRGQTLRQVITAHLQRRRILSAAKY